MFYNKNPQVFFYNYIFNITIQWVILNSVDLILHEGKTMVRNVSLTLESDLSPA